MSQVFSDYVRSLSPFGEPPDDVSFSRLWRALRGAVRRELIRRGLWETPPSCLGILGRQRWQSAGGSGDALEELVGDCYAYIFIQRCRSIRAQLRIKPEIEGLVYRNIRNFLHETQRRHDPLGFRVFVILRAALARLLDAGRLRALDGGAKLGSRTLFGFEVADRRGPSPGPGALRISAAGAGYEPEPEPAPDPDLYPLVEPWSDELLPELVTAGGAARERVTDRLGELVAGLSTVGIERFRLHELIHPLRSSVRARWAARWALTQGETAASAAAGDADGIELVRLIQPDVGVEERDSFGQLARCVARRIDRHPAQRRTRRHLAELWRFLEVFALDETPPALGRGRGLPSNRELGRHLGIPRERFPDLYATLRGLVDRCRSAAARARGDATRPAEPRPGGAMSGHDRKDELRRLTAEAVRRSEPAARGGVPEPGDLYVFETAAEPALEWLVVERVPERGRARAVAADTVPLLGSGDVEVAADEPGGPLAVRCRVAVELEASAFDPLRRTGRVAPEVVERVRGVRRALETGALERTESEAEVEADPEYREWLEDLEAARATLAADGKTAGVVAFDRAITSDPPAPPETDDRADRASTGRDRGGARMPWINTGRLWGLAATAVLALGLSFWSGRVSEDRRLAERVRLMEAELEQQRQIERRLRGELEALERGSGPDALYNLPMKWLRGEGQTRGPDDAFDLPPASPGFILVLSLPGDEPEDAVYRIEVVAAGGGDAAWRLGGLRDVDGVGEIALTLRRGVLPAGLYRIVLYREGGGDRPVSTYRLELAPEDS